MVRGQGGGSISPCINMKWIEFIEIATSGNATDFGDLTQPRIFCAQILMVG